MNVCPHVIYVCYASDVCYVRCVCYVCMCVCGVCMYVLSDLCIHVMYVMCVCAHGMSVM